MNNIIYVVNAFRWGGRENHSYFVGVYSDEIQAIKAAIDHEEYRGGKYQCEVIEAQVDREKGDTFHHYVRKIYTDTVECKDENRCSACGADCGCFDKQYLYTLWGDKNE